MLLNVKVVPNASRNRVVGRYADGIKVQVSAPPERGRANQAVIQLLAEFFSAKPAQIQLASAPSNPRKQFRILGTDEAVLQAKLASLS